MSNKPKKAVNSQKEDQELDEAFRRMAEGKSSHQKKKRPIGAIITICVLFALILCAFVLGGHYYLSNSKPVSESLRAAGINLEGMNRWEIADALEQASRAYAQSSMRIQVLDTVIELMPEDTGIRLDVNSAAQAIYESAASGSGVSGRFDLLPYLNLDADYIRTQVDTLAVKYSSALIQTTYTLEGEQPDLTPAEEPPQGQMLVITMGTPEYAVDADALYQSVLDAYNDGSFSVLGEYTLVEPKPLDLKAVQQEVSIEPVDAVMDMQTFEVTEGSCGYSFDLESAEALIAKAGYGDVVEIPMFCSNPEVMGSSLSSLLYRDVLASYSTPHTREYGRNVNLKLACEAVNGTILYPGDVFSYNATLGERTAAKGYQEAGAYVGGQTVNQIGGGICQVSSTIYYCALLADLEIVDRECHMFAPSYVPLGMDATVNWGTLDFKFRNNTNYPLRIDASMSDGYVHIALVGTEEKDYFVEMEYEVVHVYEYKTVYEEYPPDNSKGYTDDQVITTPYTGYDVYTYRCKYDKETGELISRTYEDLSDYSSRNKVVVKIVYPEPEPTGQPGNGGEISEG